MAMAKGGGGLSNSLVGRLVRRDDSLAHCWPSAFKENLSGEAIATIVAVWVEGTEKKLARALLVDPHGSMAEVWLQHVKLVVEG